MGVAVLSPKHCINQGGRFAHQAPRSSPLSTPHSKPKRGPRSAARRNHHDKNNNQVSSSPPLLSLPFPSKQKPSSDAKVYRAKSPDSTTTTGEVRILKRGEILTPQKSQLTVPSSSPPQKQISSPVEVQKKTLGLNSMGLLGSKPKISPTEAEIYAGSGFFISPPPSSVPVPAFAARKAMSDEVAASLRRILQLE